MRKTSVSLLPRGQWVCDKSREFCVRKRKLSVFAALRLKIPLGNLIPPKILHQSSIDGVSMEYPIWKKGECVAFPKPCESGTFPFPKKHCVGEPFSGCRKKMKKN